jgi:hypothetical protein
LWVASTAATPGAGTLHRLQLISGRPLRTFPVAIDLEPVRLVDVAVAPAGAVLVLDSAAPQLLILRSGGTTLQRVVRIDAQEPISVAAGADDGVAFVAHRDGVLRIDLRTQHVTPVLIPKGVFLGRLERIRWRGGALIGVQVDSDGSHHVMRLEMNAKGSAITHVTPLEIPASTTGQTFMTISGDELVCLMSGSNERSRRSSSDAASEEREFVVYRVPLR